MSRSLTTVHSSPEAGFQSIPLGLRRPAENTRRDFLAKSYSWIAARPVSLSIPFSAMFEAEPTEM